MNPALLPFLRAFGLGAGLGAAFLAGRLLTPSAGATDGVDPEPLAPVLHAQGRGATNPGPAKPEPGVTPPPEQPPQVVYTEDHHGTASANGFVAVTGSYGVGTSVLYLVDTVNRQLAIYEARGGSAEQRRVVLVGARKIDLDLQLERYNDRSEYDYRELRTLFDKRGGTDPDVSTGLERTGGNRR